MARLSLSLLGPFEATLHAEPIGDFESNKARALLAYLAVEADRPHPRAVLAALLWTDRPDRAARTNLRSALSNLRRVIGDRDTPSPLLSIARDTVQFDAAGDCWVDVATFRSLVEPDQEIAPTLQELEQAVALYQGPFLEGLSLRGSVAFDDWCLLTRERLHRQVQTALQGLAELYEDRGELSRACETMQRAVEQEPWQEEAHRQLMRLLALGGRRSAALAQYETCRRVLMADLGVEPAEETLALYERIRDGEELPAPSRGPPHNLPLPLIPLIGRQAELADTRDRLQDRACRMLTVIGPGGIGKSRLALQAAADQMGRFEHGVFLVDLAPVGSPELLTSTIMGSLNVPLHGRSHPDAQLLSYLEDKHLLLLLDNFEHLLARTTLIAQILRRAPGLKLLVTSRERLNLHQEWLLPLEGLRFPEEEIAGDGEAVAEERPASILASVREKYSAIQLFVERARQVQPHFSLTMAGPSSVADICRLVEGMPLAIELAAPWVRMMSCQEIARAIERDVGFLASSLRDVPRRHRSMQAVFDHSWGLLSDEEKQVLGRLSVFRGGFRRDAAEVVAGASIAELSALVDSSWLRTAPSGRYEMHELVRQYGAARLADEEGDEGARDRHGDYYAAFLKEQERLLKARGQKQAIEEILAEMGNVRAVWSWAVERGNVGALDRSVESLWLVSQRRGWFREMEQEFGRGAAKLREQLGLIRPDQRALRAEEATIVLAQILCCQAHHRFHIGSAERAVPLLEESLALLRGVGRSPRQQEASARTKMMLGWILDAVARDRSSPHELLQEALDQATEVGDQWNSVGAAWSLGISALRSGQYLRAEAYLRQAIAVTDESGDQWFRAWCLGILSDVLWAKGEYQGAASVAEEEYQISREIGDRSGVASSLLMLGRTASALGVYDLARQHYQDSLTITCECNDPSRQVDSLTGQATVASALGKHLEAKRLLEKGLATFYQVNSGTQIEILVGMGHATLALGEIPQSRRCFQEALELAVQTKMIPRALSALVGMAQLLAHEAEPERALGLIALVLQHPATFQVTRDRAQRLLSELESELSPEVLATAIARGQGWELEPTAAELLVELEAEPEGG